MAKTATAKRAEGVRLVAFLVDNEADIDIPDGAGVLADGMLDMVDPERTGGDKGYRLIRHDLRETQDVDIVVNGKLVKGVGISGVLDVYVTDKAITKATGKLRK